VKDVEVEQTTTKGRFKSKSKKPRVPQTLTTGGLQFSVCGIVPVP